jgi:hypothetical protein
VAFIFLVTAGAAAFIQGQQLFKEIQYTQEGHGSYGNEAKSVVSHALQPGYNPTTTKLMNSHKI